MIKVYYLIKEQREHRVKVNGRFTNVLREHTRNHIYNIQFDEVSSPNKLEEKNNEYCRTR